MSFIRTVALRHGAFAAILSLLAALYFWLTGYDDVGAAGGDGLIYLNTARHYAPYWPADAAAAIWAELTLFPPVYAVLLMLTGGAADPRLAHAVTTACLLAAFTAVYAWFVTLGIARGRAVAAALLFALVPGTFLQALYIHPEGLYVALGCTALVLLDSPAGSPGPARYWIAAAVVAAVILTRTVGVALLPALALVLWRDRPRGWPAMLAAALVPGVLWSIAHRPEWNYSAVLAENYVGVPLEAIAAKVGASIVAAVGGLAANLLRAGPFRVVVFALAAAAAAVAVWRFSRGRPDAWYVGAYAGVIALWPYPQEAQRLMWVMVPFLIGYGVWGGERLAQLAPDRTRPLVAWAPISALALIVLPEFTLLMARAAHPLAQAHPAYRHYPEWYEPAIDKARLVTELRLGTDQALQRFAPQVPADECVFSTLPFLHAGFYVPRQLRSPPGEALDDSAFAAELDQRGCRWFIFTYAADPRAGFSQPLYPLERVRGHLHIVDEQRVGPAEDGWLIAALGVRIAPDPARELQPGPAPVQ